MEHFHHHDWNASDLINSKITPTVQTLSPQFHIPTTITHTDDVRDNCTDVTCLKAFVARANKRQRLNNEDRFELVSNPSAAVIVVQIHNRTDYLRHLVDSLRKTVDISSTLVIFSHDYYSPQLDDIIRSIDFCLVSTQFILLIFKLSTQIYQLIWYNYNIFVWSRI